MLETRPGSWRKSAVASYGAQEKSSGGTGLENQPRDWKKSKRGVKRDLWEVRQYFANNETNWGRCSFLVCRGRSQSGA